MEPWKVTQTKEKNYWRLLRWLFFIPFTFAYFCQPAILGNQNTPKKKKNWKNFHCYLTHTAYLHWTCPELHKLIVFTKCNNVTPFGFCSFGLDLGPFFCSFFSPLLGALFNGVCPGSIMNNALNQLTEWVTLHYLNTTLLSQKLSKILL
jgi:hypothetical protein